MNHLPRSFKKLFFENLMELFSFKFLLLPVAVAFIKSLNADELAIAFFQVFLEPFTWYYSFGIFVADAFIRAAYWYARERNPNYIKKMEAYEKWKAEKEAKKNAAEQSETKE
jgi:hypothetical protein